MTKIIELCSNTSLGGDLSVHILPCMTDEEEEVCGDTPTLLSRAPFPA
jgi:hypothetical protein